MFAPLQSRLSLIICLSSLATISVACGAEEISENSVAPVPSPAASPVVKAAPSPTPTTSRRDPYNEAIEVASSAVNFSKTAMVSADWAMIASRWQQAADYLEAVPKSHSKYKEAQQKLPQYRRFLADAQLKAKPPQQANVEGDTNPKFFLVPIERRIGGIPLVKVKFNGREFNMLFDTGASKTLLSGEIAATLNLKPVDTTLAGIADGSVVELPIVVVDSIEINGRVKRKISAAVAKSMPVGLLGQDFFEGYDFTIKQNAIEFNLR